MEKLTRRRYTLEYKQQAVRLVASGQKVATAAKALGLVERTLANRVEARRLASCGASRPSR
jgi:transposase